MSTSTTVETVIRCDACTGPGSRFTAANVESPWKYAHVAGWRCISLGGDPRLGIRSRNLDLCPDCVRVVGSRLTANAPDRDELRRALGLPPAPSNP